MSELRCRTVIWACDAPPSFESKKLTCLLFGLPREIVRIATRDGVDAADEATPELSSTLFETEDLKGAVKSFLEDGPGNASFEGR